MLRCPCHRLCFEVVETHNGCAFVAELMVTRCAALPCRVADTQHVAQAAPSIVNAEDLGLEIQS